MKQHSISQIFDSALHDFEKAFSKDSGRPDEIGAPREKQVRDFLRLLLPEKIGVAKGYVINQAGAVSKECDIVFFNKETCPRFVLDADNDLRLFPIEEVYGTAEVKSTLEPDELENALLKLNSVNTTYLGRYDHIPEDHEDLMLRDGWREPFNVVFSYKFGTKWEDFEFLFRLHGLYSPDAVFLLDEGAYVKATDDTLARRNSFYKKTPFQVSTRDSDVWNEIVSRFSCEDRSRYYDEFIVYGVKGAILLLMMYTFILDATKKSTLPNYDSGDYIVFWAAKSNISFNRDGLTPAR
jgi:hypothetical protein